MASSYLLLYCSKDITMSSTKKIAVLKCHIIKVNKPIISLMMEAISTSETSVIFTRLYGAASRKTPSSYWGLKQPDHVRPKFLPRSAHVKFVVGRLTLVYFFRGAFDFSPPLPPRSVSFYKDVINKNNVFLCGSVLCKPCDAWTD